MNYQTMYEELRAAALKMLDSTEGHVGPLYDAIKSLDPDDSQQSHDLLRLLAAPRPNPADSMQKLHEFTEAMRPTIKWMAENCNPHQKLLVTNTSAELLGGEMSTGTIMDYIKD